MMLTLMLTKAEVALRNKRCNAAQHNADHTCQVKSLHSSNSIDNKNNK